MLAFPSAAASAVAGSRSGSRGGCDAVDPDPLLDAILCGDLDPTDAAAVERAGRLPGSRRPLIGGVAITSAAISLVGVAWVAWRAHIPMHGTITRSPAGPHPAGHRRDVRRRPGRTGLMPMKFPSFRSQREAFPEKMWTRCPSCEEQLFNKQLERSMNVCPSCGHHFRLPAPVRLGQLLDEGTFEERDSGLVSVDLLRFVDQKPYPDRLAAAQLATGLRDDAVWGYGRIEGQRVAILVMDFGFMGGSMGAVTGEKVARAAEGALDERVPLVIVSASGGARMQEGTWRSCSSPRRWPRWSASARLRVPYVSVMSDPTTGGVFASYAVVGDVNLAEPNALIGFAGARVGADTIGQELPPGFQRTEFLFRHGFVDRIVARPDLRRELARILRYLVPEPGEAGRG